jgi:hypothetical protein
MPGSITTTRKDRTMPGNGGVNSVPSSQQPTTGTSITAPRNSVGFAGLATRLFETIGVLNKGSAQSAATPKADDAAQTAGVSSNALNVTRVGGLTAFIASAGAAAIAIFNVNKTTDKASIVVAAYVSVGVIVASGLLTAAIIISSDIRGRVAAANPAPAPAPAPAGTAANSDVLNAAAADANKFGDAWYRALSMLHDAVDRLNRAPDEAIAAWLDATASTGKTQNLRPADDGQATLHARLSAGQSSVVALLGQIANDGATDNTTAIARIQSVLDSMDRSLPWPN